MKNADDTSKTKNTPDDLPEVEEVMASKNAGQIQQQQNQQQQQQQQQQK